MALAETCSAKLQEAEQKVEVLLKGADDKMRREPFGEDAAAGTDKRQDDDEPF